MRFFLTILGMLLYTSFLHSTEPSFKFTFGSNLGNIPFEVNKVSKNKKTIGGLKINSWTLSPNFSSFASSQQKSNFSEKISLKEILYIKIKLKF